MGGLGSGRPRSRPSAERAEAATVEDARALGLGPQLARVERPGRGACLYLRCKRCRGLARVLYAAPGGGLACRRCVRPVYRSSRQSDARVSRILAGDLAALHNLGAVPAVEPGTGARATARQLAATTGGLLVLLRLTERLESEHAAQGRPWSPARRAAFENSRKNSKNQ